MSLLLAAFVSGLFVRDLLKIAHGRFLMWKFEREFEAAKLRMIGCTHERVTKVDVSGGAFAPVDKCLSCWALRIHIPGTNSGWTPNSARPPKR